MSVSPSAIGSDNAPNNHAPISQTGRVPIPARWRAGQTALSVAIALVAIWYLMSGYKSPVGERGLADSIGLGDMLGFMVLLALVWLTTPAVGTIAITTWQEALRRRWMLTLLMFAIVLIPISLFFTWMQQGSEEKFVRDFGLGFTVIITTVMAIFLGAGLIQPDIERRTIFTILSKPIDRIEFLLGKYLGLCLTLLVSLAIMSLMFIITYAWFLVRRETGGFGDAFSVYAGHPGMVFKLGNLARALLLHYGALTMMAAVAMTLSLVLSHIAAVVFSFVIYFCGQAASYWEHLSSGGTGSVSAPIATVIKTIYVFVPRLDRFDVRERLVNDMPVAFNYAWKAFGGGLLYVAAVLCVAYFIFSDREF